VTPEGLTIEAFRARLDQLMQDAEGLPPEQMLDALNDHCEACRGELIRRRLRAIEDADGVEPHKQTDGA
jgi:hypothetical protein